MTKQEAYKTWVDRCQGTLTNDELFKRLAAFNCSFYDIRIHEFMDMRFVPENQRLVVFHRTISPLKYDVFEMNVYESKNLVAAYLLRPLPFTKLLNETKN